MIRKYKNSNDYRLHRPVKIEHCGLLTFPEAAHQNSQTRNGQLKLAVSYAAGRHAPLGATFLGTSFDGHTPPLLQLD